MSTGGANFLITQDSRATVARGSGEVLIGTTDELEAALERALEPEHPDYRDDRRPALETPLRSHEDRRVPKRTLIVIGSPDYWNKLGATPVDYWNELGATAG
jgi:hypothetical protein